MLARKEMMIAAGLLVIAATALALANLNEQRQEADLDRQARAQQDADIAADVANQTARGFPPQNAAQRYEWTPPLHPDGAKAPGK